LYGSKRIGLEPFGPVIYEVIISFSRLEKRNFNITTQLSSIIKAFSDFKLVAQIREEIEKVKPSLALAA
jgi:hypothetical protein